eukprot:15186331-Ditylum_brightwellii.AAC.1
MDSSYLFGGYKLLELQQSARKVALEKGLWKQLSQCFWCDSKMSLKKDIYSMWICHKAEIDQEFVPIRSREQFFQE